MILVSEDALRRMKNPTTEEVSLEQEIPSLDKQMKTILDNTRMTESEKLILYNQTLQRHIISNRKPVEKTTTVKKNWYEEIATSIPPSMLTDAISLYSWTLRYLSWNELGEMEIGGRSIPGSNLIDLIYDAVRKTIPTTNPTGFNTFYETLQNHNVPKKFIKNPARTRMLKSLSFTATPPRQNQWVTI